MEFSWIVYMRDATIFSTTLNRDTMRLWNLWLHMLTNESRFYTLSQWYLLALVQFMVTFMKTAMSLRIEISSPTNSWQPHPPEKLSRRIFGSLTVLELLKSQSYIFHVSHFESICHQALFLMILICNWNRLRYL